MDTRNGISWELVESITRTHVREHRYRLRPDMSEDDVVQEMYFVFRRCRDEVTRESIAVRRGVPIESIADEDLTRVQESWVRRAVSTYTYTQNRAWRSRYDREIRATRENCRESIGRWQWTDEQDGATPAQALGTDDRSFLREVDVRLAFSKLSPEAQDVFLSDHSPVWSTKRLPALPRTDEVARNRIGRILGSETRELRADMRRKTSRIWAEIQTVMGFLE